ncbi:hypothetical protein [Holdemanella biformis]
MNKNIVIQQSYSVDLQQNQSDFVVPQKYEGESPYGHVKRDIFGINITESLNGDLDIFTDLPESVYKEKDVALFLDALRRVIAEENPQNVTLSKLIVTEKTDSGCTLDWIYNYFRLYFSFDKNDGDYFGFMSHDTEKELYKNEFKAMKPQDFKNVAKAMLDYVLVMIQG